MAAAVDQKSKSKDPGAMSLFEERVEALGLDESIIDKSKVLPQDKFLPELYNALDYYKKAVKSSSHSSSQGQISIAEAIYSYHANKSAKESTIVANFCTFIKSFDYYCSRFNEYRFYRDLLTSDYSGKKLQVYFNIRKVILLQRQISDFAGLQMDKQFFNFEEWSTMVNRIFNPYANLSQILQQFQTNIEKQCKANLYVKQSKETLSRVSMTTLVECIVESITSLDKHFDHGRHLVEDRIGANHGRTSDPKGKTAAPQSRADQPGGKNRSRSPIHNRHVESYESPLKLINKFCEEQPRVDAVNDSKFKSEFSSQKNSLPERAVVQKEATDPYLEKMRDKKRNLAQELKVTETERDRQSKEVIRNLAELNILNKELKSLNHHYFEVSKKFEAIFRRYMQKYGRTKLTNSDLNTFSKITKEKKHIDYASKVNTELKNPFLRFMRSNFSAIKTEELDFYATLKSIKDRACRTSGLNFARTVDVYSSEDESSQEKSSEHDEEEDNQSENPTSQADPSRRVSAGVTNPLRNSVGGKSPSKADGGDSGSNLGSKREVETKTKPADVFQNKQKSGLQTPLPEGDANPPVPLPLAENDGAPLDNYIGDEPTDGKPPIPPKKPADSTPQAPVGEPTVEKIKIERSPDSDDE